VGVFFVPKHPGGRPTKYDPSFPDELDKYLQTTGKEQMSLPTIQGFALHLNVDSDTLNNWASAKETDKDGVEHLAHPEFFGTLKKLKELQAQQLIDDGIYGGKEVNATIVKLLLQNNHGMKERVDQTSNDKTIKGNTIVFKDFDDSTSE
jgi:hypothetical protein